MITEKEKKEKDLVKNKIEVILNKAKELKETFGFYPSILIEGRAGIGKSQSVLRWAARNNFKVIDIRLINYDIGDLMLKVPDGDSLKNRYVSWLKKLENTKENVILLLDEIDKAEPTIQRLAYQLVLDREVEGLKLNDNVLIVAIQNQTEDGIFNDLRREKPLWDRFVFRVRVDLDLEEFLDYAYSNFKTPELIVFLEKNRDLIYVDKEEELVVTPRRWEFLDKVLQTCDPDDLEEVKILTETVTNKEIAATFISFLEIRKKYNINEILRTADYSDVPKKDFFSIISLLVTSLSNSNDSNLIKKHVKAIKNAFGDELLLFFLKVLVKVSNNKETLIEALLDVEEIQDLIEKIIY